MTEWTKSISLGSPLKDGPTSVSVTADGFEIMKPSVSLEGVGNGSENHGPSITGESVKVKGTTTVILGGIFAKIGLTGLEVSVSFTNLKVVKTDCVPQPAFGDN